MNVEEVQRAIMDENLSDEQVHEILMAKYIPPLLSDPFTPEEIENLCKEGEKISNFIKKIRPNLWARLEQQALGEHKGCCILIK